VVNVIIYLLILAALPAASYGIAVLRFRHRERAETSSIDIDPLVEAGDIDVADTTTITDLRALALPQASSPDLVVEQSSSTPLAL
jgi:hypothetical protein